MIPEEMFSSVVNFQIAESLDEALDYTDEYKPLRASSATIVQRGSPTARPMVDMLLVDTEGNKYIVLATGSLVESLGKLVEFQRAIAEAHP